MSDLIPARRLRRALKNTFAKDLSAFLERAFRDLDPGKPFHHGEYIEYLVTVLREVAEGRERRVIINLPPRHLKSILASIVFPAWLLGQRPQERIAVISHNQDLARDLAVKCHRLVISDWYRSVFPSTSLASDRAGAMDFETTAGGGRFAASTDTGITGRGFDLIIIDDPLSAQDAASSAERERVHHAFDGMIASRLDNPMRGAIIVVHQRLHDDDLSGYLLRRGGWLHINLPLIAEEESHLVIGDFSWTRPVRDVLLPQMYPEAEIEKFRRERGEAFFSTQYQQNPTTTHGGLVRSDHITYFESLPKKASEITFSIDTAVKVNDEASYTAILVIASDGYYHYVVDVLRRRLDILETRDAVIGLIGQYGPRKILIEDASSGPGLARMLQEHRCQSELCPTRGRKKVERLEPYLHMFAEGRIRVQQDQSWTRSLVNEWTTFPNGRFDDQVDAISQYLEWDANRRVPKPVIMGAGGSWMRAAGIIFPRPNADGHPMRPRLGRSPPPRRW
jgi:predicted phage terminase large subunit-like protein